MSESVHNPLENISDEQLWQLVTLLDEHRFRADRDSQSLTQVRDAMVPLLDAIEVSGDIGEPLPVREFDPAERDRRDLVDELDDLTAQKDTVRRLLAEGRASVGAHGQLKRLYREIRATRAAVEAAESELLERNVREVFGLQDTDKDLFDYDDIPVEHYGTFGLTPPQAEAQADRGDDEVFDFHPSWLAIDCCAVQHRDRLI